MTNRHLDFPHSHSTDAAGVVFLFVRYLIIGREKICHFREVVQMIMGAFSSHPKWVRGAVRRTAPYAGAGQRDGESGGHGHDRRPRRASCLTLPSRRTEGGGSGSGAVRSWDWGYSERGTSSAS